MMIYTTIIVSIVGILIVLLIVLYMYRRLHVQELMIDHLLDELNRRHSTVPTDYVTTDNARLRRENEDLKRELAVLEVKAQQGLSKGCITQLDAMITMAMLGQQPTGVQKNDNMIK